MHLRDVTAQLKSPSQITRQASLFVPFVFSNFWAKSASLFAPFVLSNFALIWEHLGEAHSPKFSYSDFFFFLLFRESVPKRNRFSAISAQILHLTIGRNSKNTLRHRDEQGLPIFFTESPSTTGRRYGRPQPPWYDVARHPGIPGQILGHRAARTGRGGAPLKRRIVALAPCAAIIDSIDLKHVTACTASGFVCREKRRPENGDR